jgi:hypothetical protein
MTSQVILLNSYGVAIASDTAVTSGDRVTNGVEKIFRLPEPHKLALVVSGNAGLMEVPWESIIYAWSNTLTEPLETLNAYWNSLETWLSTRLILYPSVRIAENNSIERAIGDTERQLYADKLLPFLRTSSLNEKLDPLEWGSLERGNPSIDLVEKITALLPFEEFSKLTDSLDSSCEEAWNELGGDLGDFYGQLFAAHFERINAEFAHVSPEEYLLPRWPHAATLLNYLIEYTVIRISSPDPSRKSVICFVGYGNEDLFPSSLLVSAFGTYGNQVQTADRMFCPPGPNPQYILLGQKKALVNLIDGYDDEMAEAFIDTEQKLQEIAKLVPDDTTRIRRHVESRVENIENRRKIQSRSLEGPLYSLIDSTPLRNLGVFAGSLVSIQAAFATIEQPNPTVGGAIDIATINLREGFRWLQHEG